MIRRKRTPAELRLPPFSLPSGGGGGEPQGQDGFPVLFRCNGDRKKLLFLSSAPLRRAPCPPVSLFYRPQGLISGTLPSHRGGRCSHSDNAAAGTASIERSPSRLPETPDAEASFVPGGRSAMFRGYVPHQQDALSARWRSGSLSDRQLPAGPPAFLF